MVIATRGDDAKIVIEEPSVEDDTTDTQLEDSSVTNQETSSSHVEGRRRKQSTWLKDYVLGEGLSYEEATFYLVLFALYTVGGADPLNFEEAVKSERWRNSMDAEIEAIEKYGIWELIDRPKGVKTVGVKWVYKTKFNEKREVDKFKAMLVVKGYAQQYRIDYTEVFALVARLEIMRLVIVLAAQKGWAIYQLNVKSAFLHGEVVEDVFVEQPCGYIQNGKEEKEYMIKVIHCNTPEQIADVMTKPLKLDVFLKLRAMLGVCAENNVN
ncbi:UNVERIFIED_CONTAM: Retrovirus-related Pol polyprotein from transposon TNT 1-94 [Sesamum radiatum]|uniref:Retrovirus-related Pol polyprotein from transposon TNT 1-94 n=1 Tax=Sesamum radiatum TaxID=300843 RepID=A0AAW2Q1X1_SESRA